MVVVDHWRRPSSGGIINSSVVRLLAVYGKAELVKGGRAEEMIEW